ncbi:PIG-L family deacetylase [Oceanicella sp. SM1341]|uniref:PIG-L family deacetylase n=1 Tax=Oceanicella sp. SM1341 TaxID=1548889 RepID=UPI000E49CA1C|nr:PIG-L family deacetylase [Oceanicella sp. SM1341]
MSSDHARLARREAAPALMRLHRALSRLGSVLTLMNTGAHPDDEQSGLLAWARFSEGMRVVIACSTRGEGGQNCLGPERGALLGLLRSREMEEAARVLDADVAWLGHGPDDPVHDFGFSKDAEATFARWGEARIVARLARAYREYRPDIVLPTFLDVPGQHGHHRAMTRAAETAIALAALPGEGLPGWQVSHYYLPGWGGGGGTYDDAEPPPAATLTVSAPGEEAASGVSYDELGQWSRRRHASQGMGHWAEVPRRDWPLHLRRGPEAARQGEARLAEALPRTLLALAAGAGPAGPALAEADAAIRTAQRAFPDGAAILPALAAADVALERAVALAEPGFAALHGHRLARKRREIACAMAEAAGLGGVARLRPALLRPGEAGLLEVSLSPAAEQAGLAARLPEGVTAGPARPGAPVTLPLGVRADAPDTPAFAAGFDPLGGNGPVWVELSARVAGRDLCLRLDPEEPLILRRGAALRVEPDAFLRRPGERGPLRLRAEAPAPLTCALPPGWRAETEADGLALHPAPDTAPGLLTLPLGAGGDPGLVLATAGHPHVGRLVHAAPAVLRVLTLDLALPPGARVCFIGSGDGTGGWMARMGLDVTAPALVPEGEDFAAYTTVVAGVVAFGNRPDLARAVPRLHRFVARGGHLITLYQRPDQGWDAERTPPLPLQIGTPSLRWRVTDPSAPVALLAPDHPLLAGPNRITAADFDGWDKERGLYFAARRHPAYTALLSMADPGEAPLDGALVSARVGAGRHSHVALALHHQLDRMVPGAFRLLANLAAPA